MKKNINIAFNFPESRTKGISPVIEGVHIYPLNQGGVGNFINRTNWALEYHSKNAGFIELHDQPGKWRRRKKNSIHVYSPGCRYREDTRDADFPLQENYIIFTGGNNCGLDTFFRNRTLFTRINDPGARIRELMLKVGELCDNGGENVFWKVQAVFMEIIQLLVTSIKQGEEDWIIDNRSEIIKISFTDEVEKYLRQNIAAGIRTSDIARFMKVSESSLNHRFKEETGISPIARLIEIRLEFAKSLLLKGEKLVNIADMTGFYDEYHLSKAFKKKFGISPKTFRKTLE
jgi:AraC-like DNA-binding protein